MRRFLNTTVTGSITRTALTLALVVMTACKGCNSGDDADGDGFGADVDCDDGNPAVNPEATEVCNGLDDDCNDLLDDGVTGTFYADLDADTFGDANNVVSACGVGDGVVANSADCDDTNTGVHPGATETCNDIDDNCDQQVDEGVLATVYADTDGDGFGDDGVAEQHCVGTAGFSDNGDDCDDGDADINPDADEHCDGVDEDCDELIDDDAVDADTWYADDDGDGFGDPNAALLACSQPFGYVADDSDCDDTRNRVNPNALELCNTLDDNCNGLVDDNPIDSGNWYLDNDDDGYGTGTPVSSCEAPSDRYTLVTGDCDDTALDINPGADEVCDGDVDNDCDPTTDESALPSTPYWLVDADFDGFGDPVGGIQSCDPIANRVESDGTDTDCDDQEPAVNPNATEICNFIDDDCDGRIDPTCVINHCGTISSTEVWAAGYTHVVTCDIYVQGTARPTLTIGDGARVEFNDNTGIYVATGGEGKLVVSGTTSGVVFTTGAASPTPGKWDGIQIGYYDRGSTIDGATIEYAGANGYAGLYLSSSSPVITNSVFRNNLYHGIRVDSGFPQITGSEMSGNTSRGLSIDSSGGLVRGAINTNSFQNNLVTGNGDEGIQIPANYVDELDVSSSYAGNGYDEIAVLAGTIDASRTWQALDARYRVDGNVYVQGSGNPRLTIADGATLAMSTNAGLWIAQSERGSLVANGSTGGVTFTSAERSPQPGDWGGIYLGYYDSGSALTDVLVEYGGANSYGGITAYTADPVLSNVELRYNANNGFLGQSASPTITDSYIHDNLNMGVQLDDGSILLGDFDGNTVTGNGNFPVRLPAGEAYRLLTTSTYSGNAVDMVSLGADTITTTQTWNDLGVPFRAEGSIYVGDGANPTLTLAGGVDLRFATSAGLYVGTSARGRITANGSSDGIRFARDGASGTWQGVQFGSYDQGSTLTGVEITQGGAQYYGAIYAYNTSALTLDGVNVHDNANSGLYVQAGTPLVQNSTFANNADFGVYIGDSAGLSRGGSTISTFSGNTLTGNTSPMALPGNYAGELDVSSTFVGNDTDRVQLLGDYIDTSQTWSALDAEYQMNASSYVEGASSPKLTIADGVVINFVDSIFFYVGNSQTGTIDIQGSNTGVLFTSASANPIPGMWYGLYLATYSDGSTIDGLTLEYAGKGSSYGGLYLSYTDVDITDSVFRYNGYAGIVMSESRADISNTDIYDNEGDGIMASSGSSFGAFTGNDIDGNEGYAMSLPANYAGQLATSSTYSGNGNDAVALTGDYIDASQTWNALDVPYVVTGILYVEGASNPTLTIADGAELLFAPNTGMYVGYSSNNGRLVVDGPTQGVYFGSAGSQTPGAWYGLYFGYYDRGSVLNGATVEYGGASSYGNIAVISDTQVFTMIDSTSSLSAKNGLYVASATVDISGSTFADNSDNGVLIDDSSRLVVGTPSFTDNVLVGNDLAPIVLPAESVGQLDSSSSYTGNGDLINIHAGIVRTNALWQALDEDYRAVYSTLQIEGPNNPTVTVEDGVTIEFDRNINMYVGYSDDGYLDVRGGAQGVVFTSSAALPAPNDWGGLYFGSYADGSSIDGATIEYGGYNGYGNIFASSTSLTVANSVIRGSGKSGVYLSASNADISGTLIEDNNDYGLYMSDTGSSLDGGSVPSFVNNEVTGNSRAGVYVPPDTVRQLASSSSYSGNGGQIEVFSGSVRTTGTWRALDEDYDLVGTVFVEGPTNPRVTVEGGTTIYVEANVALYAGYGDDGGLDFDGSSSPILVTSGKTTRGRGDWQGIYYGYYALDSEIVGTTVEYGGGNSYGNIFATNAVLTLDGVTSRQSSKSGVYLSASEAEIFDSTFSDNNDYGVYLDSSSLLSKVSVSAPTFVNNTLTRNAQPISLPGDSVGELDASSTYTGNTTDRVNIFGSTVRHDAVWQDLDADFWFTGGVYIEGPLNPIVTIDPSVRLLFATNTGLYVGNSDDGGLVAAGAIGQPVTFTSANATPGKGDWYGIYFGSLCLSGNSDLDRVTVSYGGAAYNANVAFYSCAGATVTNSTITNSSHYGIYRSNSTPLISGNTYSGNNDGDVY